MFGVPPEQSPEPPSAADLLGWLSQYKELGFVAAAFGLAMQVYPPSGPVFPYIVWTLILPAAVVFACLSRSSVRHRLRELHRDLGPHRVPTVGLLSVALLFLAVFWWRNLPTAGQRAIGGFIVYVVTPRGSLQADATSPPANGPSPGLILPVEFAPAQSQVPAPIEVQGKGASEATDSIRLDRLETLVAELSSRLSEPTPPVGAPAPAPEPRASSRPRLPPPASNPCLDGRDFTDVNFAPLRRSLEEAYRVRGDFLGSGGDAAAMDATRSLNVQFRSEIIGSLGHACVAVYDRLPPIEGVPDGVPDNFQPEAVEQLRLFDARLVYVEHLVALAPDQ